MIFLPQRTERGPVTSAELLWNRFSGTVSAESPVAVFLVNPQPRNMPLENREQVAKLGSVAPGQEHRDEDEKAVPPNLAHCPLPAPGGLGHADHLRGGRGRLTSLLGLIVLPGLASRASDHKQLPHNRSI